VVKACSDRPSGLSQDLCCSKLKKVLWAAVPAVELSLNPRAPNVHIPGTSSISKVVAILTGDLSPRAALQHNWTVPMCPGLLCPLELPVPVGFQGNS
jgi:hypothetical protein